MRGVLYRAAPTSVTELHDIVICFRTVLCCTWGGELGELGVLVRPGMASRLRRSVSF